MPVPTYTGAVTAQTDPNKTAFTATGRSGQSVDIFDVTLTPGGTKVLSIDANGKLNAGGLIMTATPSGGTASQVWVANDQGSTNGMEFNIPSASTNGYRFRVNAGVLAQLASTGAFSVAPSINSAQVLGVVAPCYTASGATLAATTHFCTGTVSGTGSTATVSLTNNGVFANGNFAVFVFDANGGGSAAVTVSGGSSFSFPTTNGHAYTWFAFGA